MIRRLRLFWLSIKLDSHRGAFTRCVNAQQWEFAEEHQAAIGRLRRERARLERVQ